MKPSLAWLLRREAVFQAYDQWGGGSWARRRFLTLSPIHFARLVKAMRAARGPILRGLDGRRPNPNRVEGGVLANRRADVEVLAPRVIPSRIVERPSTPLRRLAEIQVTLAALEHLRRYLLADIERWAAVAEGRRRRNVR